MQSTHTRRRKIRLAFARILGSHTKQQWIAMCNQFDNRCVRCGISNVKLTRDHIVPIFIEGDDSIDNIQPLCRSCNSSKMDCYDWKKHRIEKGWDILVPRLDYLGRPFKTESIL